ncbi:membrane-bound O-acyltransferase family protein [Moraxella caviae]|uniref:Probable alginate O-acetylase n=1 Tax=Moraxella caviae TaxID=34060 RepID=A0A1S9ZUQ6_9GAMM|nr:MBOAT family O-acyltransferase [Moraxella caviae]OOR87242.1 membrane-bound O-acyltransferase family protein [Moraxella caviae]STZ14824.1 D-alanyl-lipoteichoic acid biosynthesis protein DltB [Moraxella caviae]VEW11283.1 D-alanyl-lipoteichoic acid biosynthesis protein DltB [Moraxella caviae]
MFSFLSVEFALIFIVFFALYWAFYRQSKVQNGLLLIFSYFIIFLMAGAIATSVLLLFSVLIFIISRMLMTSLRPKFWLVLGIVVTIANLAVFKYYEFFRANIVAAMQALQLDASGVVANIVFPLGISYYSFQAISYLVTLHQRRANHAVSSPLTFWQLLTHLSFFSTISAGPITRVDDTKGLLDIEKKPCGMQAQLITTAHRKPLLPMLAFALILLALAKKWWLAGYLADTWVNPVFANPEGFHSLEVLAAIYGYTLQLFLDFSGYSEMMVAFGLLLGFRLPMNFNAPLLAHNIRDFWDRWHISLSTWIRDYIYIPLGGSRNGFVRTQINLIIAMVLSGIWHGSTLNFFFWGLFHGLAIALLNVGDKVLQNRTSNPKGRNFLAGTGWLGKGLGVFTTIHFVVFAFVFFRATTFEEALLIFKALFTNHINVAWANNPLYLLSLLLIAWLLYPVVRNGAKRLAPILAKVPNVLLYLALFIGFMLVVVLAPSGIPGFIYANF